MKQTNKITVKNKKSVYVRLNEFCSFSTGPRKNDGDFLEVSMWLNGEGYDITISDVNGNRQFFFTDGQFDALKKCIKTINKHNE